MGLDEQFIKVADEIRRNIMNIDKFLISDKKSKYNSKVFINRCILCNEKTEEVHHIQEQHLSNNNMIEHFHKNSLFNLVQLCHSCHHQVHHGCLVIDGWIDTSDGISLSHHKSQKNIINSKKKYNQDQISIIQDIYSKSKNYSLTRRLLSENHKLEKISTSTIKKIVNKEY